MRLYLAGLHFKLVTISTVTETMKLIAWWPEVKGILKDVHLTVRQEKTLIAGVFICHVSGSSAQQAFTTSVPRCFPDSSSTELWHAVSCAMPVPQGLQSIRRIDLAESKSLMKQLRLKKPNLLLEARLNQ